MAPTSLQLVATLGPASLGLARELADAGATHFRLNASHLMPGQLREIVARVQAQAPEVPLVVDLQGAKMRLGRFEERTVRQGQQVRFALKPHHGEVPLPHPELFQSAACGQTLTCDDGRVRLRVLAVENEGLLAEALGESVLRPRKGVNLLEHPVDLEGLTAQDEAFLDALSDVPGVSWAFSFMKDGREAAWLRARVPGPVIGKIEREEAIRSLDAIARQVDAIWICRGDLGEQLGLPKLARFVGGFDPRRLGVPVLMAGQVLEHLTEHSAPTRSEVCHLHDLIGRGFAGIVLSDETAIGRGPARAVETAASLLGA